MRSYQLTEQWLNHFYWWLIQSKNIELLTVPVMMKRQTHTWQCHNNGNFLLREASWLTFHYRCQNSTIHIKLKIIIKKSDSMNICQITITLFRSLRMKPQMLRKTSILANRGQELTISQKQNCLLIRNWVFKSVSTIGISKFLQIRLLRKA
jgi:hypothetical protein